MRRGFPRRPAIHQLPEPAAGARHRKTDQILGAVILGIEGGEISTVLQVATMGRVPYMAIRDGVFSSPHLGGVPKQPVFGAKH